MYFPRADSEIILRTPSPKETAIFDSLSSTPLSPYNATQIEKDGYLYPTLTSNERLRLTMMWYYTKDLQSDTALLERMQQKVNLLQTFTGWEYVICGIVNNDIFQRIVTAGMAPSNVPRRESTCSHTIQDNSVVYIPDMKEDSRFAKSPPVQNGLRCYAGAQLKARADNEDVMIGSLCVASTKKQDLNESQIEVLAQFADMITADIIEGSRRRRALQQRKYESQLTNKTTIPEIIDLLKTIYNTDVEIGDQGDFEDTNLIDHLIQTQNHTKITSTSHVRGITGRIRNRYLTVATKEVTQIFDDIDIRFVQSCASKITSIMNEQDLQQALQAKVSFMRGITHQLRTPLHGILGAASLLLEDTQSDNLQMIRDSGLELMSIVNNIIKMNNLIDTSRSKPDYDGFAKLEQDILEDISWVNLDNIMIFFDNSIADMGVNLDVRCIRDCLQPLVLNAVQHTSQGSVTVSIHSKDYNSIICDVIDTGSGILPADQERIFNAYEKGNDHTSGAGLGLTLACKIATAIKGSITLVSSTPQGSHFQAVFKDVTFSCSMNKTTKPPPQRFRGTPSQFTKFLTSQGWQEDEEASIVIMPFDTVSTATVCLIPTNQSHLKEQHSQCAFFTGPFSTARLKQILYTISKQEMTLVTRTRSKRTPRCLLVDDNAVNLRILCHFCQKRKLPYVTAMDGHEAVEAYSSSIDLILLDLQMPRKDGIQACKDIRVYEKENGLQPALIYIVTGQDSPEDRRKADEAGADRFFVKPLALKSLEQAITKAFSM